MYFKLKKSWNGSKICIAEELIFKSYWMYILEKWRSCVMKRWKAFFNTQSLLFKNIYLRRLESKIFNRDILITDTFGIPSGIVFSQPACLKITNGGTRVWIPCDDFPLPEMPVSIFRNLICTAATITQRLMSANKIWRFKNIGKWYFTKKLYFFVINN